MSFGALSLRNRPGPNLGASPPLLFAIVICPKFNFISDENGGISTRQIHRKMTKMAIYLKSSTWNLNMPSLATRPFLAFSSSMDIK